MSTSTDPAGDHAGGPGPGAVDSDPVEPPAMPDARSEPGDEEEVAATPAVDVDEPDEDDAFAGTGLPPIEDLAGDESPAEPGLSEELDWVPWHQWQTRLVGTLVLGIAGGWVLAGVATALFEQVRPLLVSLMVALFISFALEPAVKWLSTRGMSRGAATGLVFVLTTLSFVGFLAAMVPLIVTQVTRLVQAGPSIVAGLSRQARALPGELGPRAAEWLAGLQADLPNQLPSLAESATREVLSVGASLMGTVLNLLTIALVAFYLAADGPRLRRVLSSNMQPRAQREFLEIWEIAVAKTGGYLYGRVLTAIVSALFHTTVFLVIGLDYAFALGAWVGVVSSVVPVVGTYLAGILPLAIALSSSPADALWVLVAIVVYQQVENLVVVPRITGQTVELHPAVAFVSVLLGAALLGAIGALLAIPTAAIISALWSTRREVHEVVEHHLTHHEPHRRRQGGT